MHLIFLLNLKTNKHNKAPRFARFAALRLAPLGLGVEAVEKPQNQGMQDNKFDQKQGVIN